jgi:hypothetical protein
MNNLQQFPTIHNDFPDVVVESGMLLSDEYIQGTEHGALKRLSTTKFKDAKGRPSSVSVKDTRDPLTKYKKASNDLDVRQAIIEHQNNRADVSPASRVAIASGLVPGKALSPILTYNNINPITTSILTQRALTSSEIADAIRHIRAFHPLFRTVQRASVQSTGADITVTLAITDFASIDEQVRTTDIDQVLFPYLGVRFSNSAQDGRPLVPFTVRISYYTLNDPDIRVVTEVVATREAQANGSLMMLTHAIHGDQAIARVGEIAANRPLEVTIVTPPVGLQAIVVVPGIDDAFNRLMNGSVA